MELLAVTSKIVYYVVVAVVTGAWTGYMAVHLLTERARRVDRGRRNGRA